MSLLALPVSQTAMNTPRFYYPDPLQAHQHFDLPGATAHYAQRVLRLRNGAQIVLFDGLGGQYPAHLEFQGKKATALTGEHDPVEAELTGRITLIQGLATADKMDWIIEKAVELGAHRVIPVAAQRSVLQLRGERLEKRLQHWRRIAQAASEQCGRNRLMIVDEVHTLAELLGNTTPQPNETTFLCHPDYGTALNQAVPDFLKKRSVTDNTVTPVLNLMIGPEGGWSESELTLAAQAGITPVQFGSRILRTETAGLAMIAACTALLGWNCPQQPVQGA